MKKKFISIFLIILIVFTMTACINKETKKESKKTNIDGNNNSVVLYFSATGTTKKIAKRIANFSNSDIIEIIPKEKYKSEDLNYNSDCRANKEQNDDKSRPEIKNEIDVSKYDTIYLGYPIWWGTNPKIILTLLDTYDFTGKIIIPFCTSGSTDISGSVNDLRKYNSKLDIKDGKRFESNASDEEIKTFIKKKLIKETKSMKAIIDNKEYTINLEDNNTVNSLIKMLPLELTMDELNGNEKYVNLDTSLPTKSYNPKRIESGDVMLFGDNCLVVFYKSFDTTYSYTKIGHIDNLPNLGNGSIKIKLEL